LDTLGSSLKRTLSDSDLPSVIGEATEVIVDSLLEEGALRDLPVISSLIGVAKTWGTVKDHIFAKKLLAFLKQVATFENGEAIAAVRKWEHEHGFNEDVGETLVELLDRVDGNIKPRWIAIALKHYAEGSVTWEDLLRINNAIVRVLTCDLPILDSLSKGDFGMESADHPAVLNLVSAGLCNLGHGYGGPIPEVTDLGLKFRLIVGETKI
jgi:hypothetical protein